MDDKGVLITHPKYTMKDNVNIAADKYGTLATIVKDEMFKGKEGLSRYNFEGVDKIVSYVPVTLGEYSVYGRFDLPGIGIHGDGRFSPGPDPKTTRSGYHPPAHRDGRPGHFGHGHRLLDQP